MAKRKQSSVARKSAATKAAQKRLLAQLGKQAKKFQQTSQSNFKKAFTTPDWYGVGKPAPGKPRKRTDGPRDVPTPVVGVPPGGGGGNIVIDPAAVRTPLIDVPSTPVAPPPSSVPFGNTVAALNRG